MPAQAAKYGQRQMPALELSRSQKSAPMTPATRLSSTHGPCSASFEIERAMFGPTSSEQLLKQSDDYRGENDNHPEIVKLVTLREQA